MKHSTYRHEYYFLKKSGPNGYDENKGLPDECTNLQKAQAEPPGLIRIVIKLDRLAFIVGPQPGLDRRRVGAEFVWLKVQSDLAGGSFGSVGSMDQVHLAAGAIVATDRAGSCLETTCRTEQVTHDTNDFESLKDHRHDRTAVIKLSRFG